MSNACFYQMNIYLKIQTQTFKDQNLKTCFNWRIIFKSTNLNILKTWKLLLSFTFWIPLMTRISGNLKGLLDNIKKKGEME